MCWFMPAFYPETAVLGSRGRLSPCSLFLVPRSRLQRQPQHPGGYVDDREQRRGVEADGEGERHQEGEGPGGHFGTAKGQS